jgi:hypothetical protein
MGSAKGSTNTTSNQTSAPPAWAQPLLQKAASSAMNLYNSGSGYNVYRGPQLADFSQQKIDALNRIMQLTGGGAQVSNAAMTGSQNPQIAQAQALIQQQMQQQAAAKAAAAAAAARPQAPPQQPQQWAPNPNGNSWGNSGGWRRGGS